MKKMLILILFIHASFCIAQTPFYLIKGESECTVLYSDCINDLWIDVPQWCEKAEKYEIEAVNCPIWQDPNDKRHIRIVPNHNRLVVFRVSEYKEGKKTTVSDAIVTVIDAPGESFRLSVDGNSSMRNNRIDRNSKITFQTIPDSRFAIEMPNECDYRIDSISVYLSPNGNQPPLHITTLGYDIEKPQPLIEIILPEACFSYPSSSEIYLEIKNVYRKNGEGLLLDSFYRCSLDKRLSRLYLK